MVRLVHLSDLHVIDVASPARAEWVELLGDDPRWRPLLHMHRPYEALTHWALAAHVEAIHRDPTAPWTGGRVRPRAQHRRQHRQRPAQRARRLPRDHGGRPTRSCGRAVGRRIPTAATSSRRRPRADAPWPFWCPEPGCRRHVEAARLPGGRGLLRARRRAGHVTGRRHPVGEPARQPRRDAPGHVADERTARAHRRRVGQVVAAAAGLPARRSRSRCSSTNRSGSRAARCDR